jgi:ribonuclease Z
VKENNIPLSFYERLKEGEDFVTTSGQVVKNDWLTIEAPKGKTYAFCADTKYNEAMIEHIKDADMIYHETTYLDNLRERADSRFHSTTKQAALIAQKANVKKLLIGHFSSKYDTLEEFEQEAREVFVNTELALEGVAYKV